MVIFIDYFKTLVKQFFLITRKPKYPDLTKISGSDQISGSEQDIRIQPKHPDPTIIPGSDQNTRIRPEYPDPSRISGSDQSTRIRPKYPDPTKIPGSDQNTKIFD